jgi:NADH-quinone oxidoreductase B subunit
MAMSDDSPTGKRLPLYDESALPYEHPLYKTLLSVPGLSVAVAPLDLILQWGMTNALWIFPMATSCCGIELMAAAASRVDLDRMGTIVRATPRQADVMVVAGTITVKMAPRVKTLWEQMPEPRWCIAMGSCAISGDFYRNLYSVIPGIDTVLPVDVYIPGCPPNPEGLMHGLLRLQEKVKLARQGGLPARDENPSRLDLTRPSVARFKDPARDPSVTLAQEEAALHATAQDSSDERSEDAPPVTVSPEVPRATDEAGDFEAILAGEFGVTEFPKDAPPIVEASRHVALARRLRSAGYRQLVLVAATHYPEKTGAKAQAERFEVTYGLRTIGAGSRVALWRVVLSTAETVGTLVGVFAGADWQEREQFDLVGVRFEGHPDLRRLMLSGDWQGHPLRKDYPANTACAPWR